MTTPATNPGTRMSRDDEQAAIRGAIDWLSQPVQSTPLEHRQPEELCAIIRLLRSDARSAKAALNSVRRATGERG